MFLGRRVVGYFGEFCNSWAILVLYASNIYKSTHLLDDVRLNSLLTCFLCLSY